MFRAALIKLTLLYLLIIMAISLFFSLTLYNVSGQEITNNAGRQQNNIMHFGRGGAPIDDPAFIIERDRIIADAKQNILNNLLYTNAIILVIGGGLSYFLAGRTLKPIEEVHESQSRFTSDASHELRSPLAAMKTEIEVALRDPDLTKADAIALLTSNLEEVERLRTLSEELLSLARDGGETIEKTDFVLGSTIDKAIDLASKEAKKKKITITTDLVDKIIIHASEDSIRQLVMIVLDNAIKYSEPTRSVRVETSAHNKYAVIRINDEGAGIEKDDLDKIFERFYRVDQSRTKNKVPGYGLGLALARKIATANHGSITAESGSGSGSTFTIKLPLAKT